MINELRKRAKCNLKEESREEVTASGPKGAKHSTQTAFDFPTRDNLFTTRGWLLES